MDILVEILHTEFQYISLIKCKSIIEIEKQLRKEEQKKMDLLSRLVTPTGTKGCARHVALAAPTKGCFLSRLPDPGQKGTPFPFCPGLTFSVGKPGQQKFSNRDKSAFL